jgi:hypothetical protein
LGGERYAARPAEGLAFSFFLIATGNDARAVSIVDALIWIETTRSFVGGTTARFPFGMGKAGAELTPA